MENDKISIIDESGNTIICDILFTFDSAETNKSYVVYTDNSKDDFGNIKVYANTYDINSDNGTLGIIDSDKEWALIEQIFDSIKEKKED